MTDNEKAVIGKAEAAMNLASAYLDRVGTGDLSDPATGHARRLQIAAGALNALLRLTAAPVDNPEAAPSTPKEPEIGQHGQLMRNPKPPEVKP